MLDFKEAPKVDLEAPKLLRVRPGPPLEVKLLNKRYTGIDTHYWGGHTISCPGPATCKACGQGLIPVYSGFIFVQLWDGGRIALLALTPVMCAMITMRTDSGSRLLGMKVRFRRKTKEANSGVLTTFHGTSEEVDEQSFERLLMRVRIIFKDYVIQDSGEMNTPASQRAN